jgi:hypothetical protein
VLDLDEAKGITRSTIETSTVVVVATRQAFQVKDEESRKVYESNRSLMHHFDNLSPIQRDELLSDGETIPYSPRILASNFIDVTDNITLWTFCHTNNYSSYSEHQSQY